MKRTLALAVLMALAILPALSVTEAWARAGGGSSSGSRGSRSYTAPAQPSSPVSPRQPSSPAVSPAQPRPGWGGMMGGMLGGLLLGGLLGGLLFGGGFGSGIGLMEIVIIAGLGWVAFSYMRRRQAAAPSGYAMAGGGYTGSAPRDDAAMAARYGSGTPVGGTATLEPPTGPSDLERGLGHVRQMDAGFDPRAFAETASDVFFKVQGAWTARDLRSVSASLTPEMQAQLQRDCDRLRAEQKINRLEEHRGAQRRGHRGLAGDRPGLCDRALPGEPARLHHRRERRPGARRQPHRAGEVRGVLDLRPSRRARPLPPHRHPAGLGGGVREGAI